MSAADPATIEALFMDVDGVLTDGRILLGDDGIERRSYNVRDGIGIKLCRRAGIKLALVTSSPSAGVRVRGERLGIDHVSLDVKDKADEIRKVARALGLETAKVAFIGDDLVDIPAMKEAGLAMAVADAAPEVIATADVVTKKPGGMGAVREACEMLLAARNPELLRKAKECGLSL